MAHEAGKSPKDFERADEKTGKPTTYTKLRSAGYIFLLFAGSLWLIVHSPITKPAPLADSIGILLATTTISIIALSVTAILYGFLRRQPGQYSRQFIRAIGGVSLIFGLSFLAVNHYSIQRPIFGADAGGILLAAASLALFIFATLIAAAGLIGLPTFGKYIHLKVEETVNPILKEMQAEIRGRSFSNTGLALGELSREKKSRNVDQPGLLNTAVESCRAGFYELESAAEGPRLMALNNWLYYSTLQEVPLPDLTQTEILQYAHELERFGRKNYARRLQLTYCRIVARCVTSEEERLRASGVLAEISKNLSPDEQIEARDCRALFDYTDLG